MRVALCATLLACQVIAAPALAQRDRVFVASYGSDSNPCTFGSPCKTFQNAVDTVAAGGEVTAIDSAGFGTISISHSVTITSPNGIEAGIATPSGGTAITINADTNDIINLNGLTLDGGGSASTGIAFNSGEVLNVQNSVIRNFSGDGIDFFPAASSQLFVSNALVADNSGDGINFSPTGSGTTFGALDHVTMQKNHDNGLVVYGNAPTTINVTVTDSMSANNGDGINSYMNFDSTIDVTVRDSTIINNTTNGLISQGTNSTVWVTRSTITGNGTGVAAENDGTLTSFGDNTVKGNGTNGSPSSTIGNQ
jgi:hypothetical protein